MKLRYYLRGLGIGMLVAALVLVLSGNTNAKMSDEAVKRRAAELGMVEKDKSVLGDVGNGKDAENGIDDTADSSSEEVDAVLQNEVDASGGTGNVEENGNGAVSDETGTEKTQDAEIARVDEIEARADEVAQEAAEGRTVNFEVIQGDTSISVARRAKEAGLVASAADFDFFLCQNGYSKKLAIGSYELTEGMSEEEIADILTRSAR